MARDETPQERAEREEQERKNRLRCAGSAASADAHDIDSMTAHELPRKKGNSILDVGEEAMNILMTNPPENTSKKAKGTEKVISQLDVLTGALERTITQLDNDPMKESSLDLIDKASEGDAAQFQYAISDMLSNVKALREFIHSDEFQQIADFFPDFAAWIDATNSQRTVLDLLFYGDMILKSKPILPYFIKELQTLSDSASPDKLSLADFMRSQVVNGKPVKSLFHETLERAAKAAEADKANTGADGLEIEPIRATLQRVEDLFFPLDKVSSNLFNKLQPNKKNKLVAQFDTSPTKGENAFVCCVVDYEGLEKELPGIEKFLTPTHELLSIVIAGELACGNDITTVSRLYKLMGHEGRAGKKDLMALNDLLTVVGKTRLHIDNTREIGAYKDYDRFVYDGALIPFERVGAYISGKWTDAAIHIFREPPLISFARMRGQVALIPAEILNAPINSTDANIAIGMYLIRRICHMKNPHDKTGGKILLSTLYQKCQIPAGKPRQRALVKIRKYLDHYKNCGWIQDCKIDTAEGYITVTV